MTVIPLFCSKFLKGVHHGHGRRRAENRSLGGRFNAWFNRMFNRCWISMSAGCGARCKRPGPDAGSS